MENRTNISLGREEEEGKSVIIREVGWKRNALTQRLPDYFWTFYPDLPPEPIKVSSAA